MCMFLIFWQSNNDSVLIRKWKKQEKVMQKEREKQYIERANEMINEMLNAECKFHVNVPDVIVW